MGIIDVSKLSFSFGKNRILDNNSFSIDKNKFYSIIGPNGSGKTTLLNCLSAFYETSGNISILGKDINKYKRKEFAKIVAVVPQDTSVAFEFSVLDVVLMGRSPYIKQFSSESEEDLAIVQKAMEVTEVWHLRDRSINEISGGERQRALIARAIAQQTEIILLDEPVSSLDMYHELCIMEKLKQLKNTTVVAVLHDLNLAARYSDYFILMHKGQIISVDTPQKTLTSGTIKQVYNVNSHIMISPVLEKPFVIPY